MANEEVLIKLQQVRERLQGEIVLGKPRKTSPSFVTEPITVITASSFESRSSVRDILDDIGDRTNGGTIRKLPRRPDLGKQDEDTFEYREIVQQLRADELAAKREEKEEQLRLALQGLEDKRAA